MDKTWLTDWIRVQQHIVTIAFLILATLVEACGLVVGEQLQLLIALSVICLTGVSHGAVDHLVEGRFVSGKIGMVWLLALYITLVCFVAGLWWVIPGASLLVFLSLSVIHFGTDLQRVGSTTSDLNHLVGSLIRGSIPILIPCYTHPIEVTRYFNMLGCLVESRSIIAVTSQLMCLFWAFSIIYVINEYRTSLRQNDFSSQKASQFAEHFALAVMCWFLPPLLSFAAYFGFLHSVRHILRLAFLFDEQCPLNGLSQFALLATPATVISIVGAALIFLCTQSTLATAEVRTLFISLSALTVPHMFLAFLADVLGGNVSTNPAAISTCVAERP